MVVIDTSIIVDHLRQKPGTETYLLKLNKREGKDSLYFSVITLQELYEGRSTRDEKKLAQMLTVLSPLKVLGYNREIAEIAGKMARDLKTSIEFTDAAIAATCIFNDFKLATLNKKHFQDIRDLDLYALGK